MKSRAQRARARSGRQDDDAVVKRAAEPNDAGARRRAGRCGHGDAFRRSVEEQAAAAARARGQRDPEFPDRPAGRSGERRAARRRRFDVVRAEPAPVKSIDFPAVLIDSRNVPGPIRTVSPVAAAAVTAPEIVDCGLTPRRGTPES